MKNILDELFDFSLSHLTRISDVGDANRKALERLVKAETELLKAIPDCRELLDEYQAAEIAQTDLSNRYEFIQGFKLGAQLVLEMLKPLK